MEPSSRGITLDQLQSTDQAASGETMPSSSDLTLAHNPLAILDSLLKQLSPTRSLTHIAQSLATTTKQFMEMDLCVVMLANGVHGQLTIEASSPDLNGRILAIPPITVEPVLWEKLRIAPGELPALHVQEQEQLNPLKNVEYKTLHIIPLVVGLDCLGLLLCYSSKTRDLAAQDLLVLQTLSSYAALSIQNRLLIDADLSGTSIKTFFDDLLSGNSLLENELHTRAAALGCNLAQPHVMLLLEVGRLSVVNTQVEESQLVTFQRAIKHVELRLQEHFPGSLLDEREHLLHCIVALDKDHTLESLKTWLNILVEQVESEQQVSVFVGVSSLCNDLGEYRRGFAEAEEALKIGACLHTRASSTCFDELGVNRYIYSFARNNTLRDLYLEQIAAIDRYDQGHKRAELLDTLEAYLAHGCNIKETSELLDVHRNTLTQRLERIQSLCSVDLDQYSNRLPLQVALMVHRLRS